LDAIEELGDIGTADPDELPICHSEYT